MKSSMWHCDICGSTDITQECMTMVPMNSPTAPSVKLTALDHFWCPTCEDECHPIVKETT